MRWKLDARNKLLFQFTLDYVFATGACPPIAHTYGDNGERFLSPDMHDEVKLQTLTRKQATEAMSDALFAISQLTGVECLPGLVTRCGRASRLTWPSRTNRDTLEVKPRANHPKWLLRQDI